MAASRRAMFKIEDELHDEPHAAEFDTFEDALDELKRMASVPWNKTPNRAPCMSWRTCGRSYEVVEYDVSDHPWRELQRVAVLSISAEGSKWVSPF